jgi:TPR repeat protein
MKKIVILFTFILITQYSLVWGSYHLQEEAVDGKKYRLTQSNPSILLQKRNCFLSLRSMEKQAFSGDKDYQFYVGLIYYHRKKYIRAFKFFKMNAEQNDPRGQFCVGCMYCEGEGPFVDISKAMTYFSRASEQGHVAAKDNLKALINIYRNEP